MAKKRNGVVHKKKPARSRRISSGHKGGFHNDAVGPCRQCVNERCMGVMPVSSQRAESLRKACIRVKLQDVFRMAALDPKQTSRGLVKQSFGLEFISK